MAPTLINGKVSHRSLGRSVADLTETVNHNAHALNNQGRMLKAYGERLADALVTIEQLKERIDKLETVALENDPMLADRERDEETEEQPV